MQYSVYSDSAWTYPDSPHTQIHQASLEAARGGHAAFQLLGDTLDTGTPISVSMNWEQPCGLSLYAGELLPVGVDENTSATLMTTTDYESCRDFVTRKAPFYVYDAIRPLENTLTGIRLALYLSLQADCEEAPGLYTGTLHITVGEDKISVPVSCRVHSACVPPIGKARLGMLNFFDYEGLTRQHNAAENSEGYWALFRRYVRAQLTMRCTHILLPSGRPIMENGIITGFDFSAALRAGRIAMEEGAPYLCGGHIAHWAEWTGEEYFLSWSPSTGVSTPEGYLQLRRYFTVWADIIRQNGWEGKMTQALADEPQEGNARTYRILAAICRKFLPGVPILDAVETTNLGGGIDIWVPKQDTFEKKKDTFRLLQDAGEEIWFYTCAFPAGNIMNRSMDLPLTVSRLLLWMGASCRLTGFLHWGFNYYIGDNIWNRACCPHKGALLPAGDAHIVYPGPDGPWISMRYEAQRGGAEDYELFSQILLKNPAAADSILSMACTDFRTYTADPALLAQARHRLLEEADRLS